MPLPGPETHVVELRVPGLIGTSGESLLDSVDTVAVAGDGVGRIIRPSDRLRRPAPGPVLQALGRSVSRTLEGYQWSRMTSGGTAKAAWALLFPFSLANVAHWMLPPLGSSTAARALGVGCRALLRVAALLLTMLLVSQLAVVSLDLLAVQCLEPGSRCLSSAPTWMRRSAGVRTAIGVLPLLLVVLVLYRVSSASWSVAATRRIGRSEAGLPGGALSGATLSGATLPGDVLADDEAETTMLRCLHTVGALACVTVLLLGGPLHAPDRTADVVVWVLALAVAGFAVGAAALRARRVLGRVLRPALITLAAGLFLLAAIVRTPLPPTTPEATNHTVEVLGAALFAVCLLFATLLIPTALTARSTWATLPKRLRPWAGGWAAAPTLALAGLLGGGFGAGLAIAARHLLDANLRLPAGYTLITLLWGAGLAFTLVLTVSGFAVAVPLRRVRRGIPEVVRLMGTREADQREAADAWARASWERKYLHRIVLAIVLALGTGATVLVAMRLAGVAVPSGLDPLSGVGVVTLGALAAGLLRAVYTAATGGQRGRHLAAFADLVCFWPRAAHPAVPPSYALKVVPEVADRAREQLREPDSRVVLAGYHVGGLLAVLAAGRLVAELPDAERHRLGLVTAGAPLQWGYQRAFPAVFPHSSLGRLYASLDGRWRGLCRGTDTFGGGATTWRHQVAGGTLLGVGYLPDGGVGALEPAVRGPRGVLVLGGDHWLPDPLPGPESGRRWVAGVRRHADYVADPEWDRAVARAAGLDGPPTRQPPVQPPGQPRERPQTTTRPAGPIPMSGDPFGEPRRVGDGVDD